LRTAIATCLPGSVTGALLSDAGRAVEDAA
jgi:hypothetical protein